MRTPLIALTALALTLGAPASARDFVVKYDDLDLSTPKGQKTLDRRIVSAARTYCGFDQMQTGTRTKSGSPECLKDAVSAAREQMAGIVSKAQKGG